MSPDRAHACPGKDPWPSVATVAHRLEEPA